MCHPPTWINNTGATGCEISAQELYAKYNTKNYMSKMTSLSLNGWPSTCRNMELKELKEKTQTKEGDEEIVLMCTCFAFRINLKFSKYKQYFIICTFHIHFTRLFFSQRFRMKMNWILSVPKELYLPKMRGKKHQHANRLVHFYSALL